MKRTLYTILLLISIASTYGQSLSNVSVEGISVGDIQANTPVIANNDFARTFEMTPVEINISKNDYGISQGISRIDVVDGPKRGKAVVTSYYTIIYTPGENFTGSDSLTYQICNNYNECGRAMIRVVVEDYDFALIAHNDTLILFQTKNVKLDVLKNDEFLYDKPITLEILRDLSKGTSQVSSELLIVPDLRSYGLETDSLLYRVCDAEGDCDEAWLFLTVNKEPERIYFIPEGFSPNGDGINDTFNIPDFLNFANIEINIFNRAGVLVYESKDWNNNWDGVANTGIYKGKQMESGTYYYLIEIRGLESFKGFVYLSR